MFRMIIMTLSLVAVIIVNATANILPLNGKTTIEIINRLPILFTPANYVFVIWIVIYVLLACWLFGFRRSEEKVGQVNAKLVEHSYSFSVAYSISLGFCSGISVISIGQLLSWVHYF